MTSITDIRSRIVIECSEAEALAEIGACLGGVFTLNDDGSWSIEPWQNGLTDAGELFRAQFHGRRFASLLSVACIVMDIQLERCQ